MRTATLRALVALIFVLMPAPSGNAKDFKIVPGERVGDISITMSFEEIQKLLGAPSRVDRVNVNVSVYEWRSHQIRIYQDLNSGRAVIIRTYWLFRTPSSYSTDKGIRFGASIEQIKQAYGDAGCFVREGAGWREFSWHALGIDFIINTDPSNPNEIQNRVSEIGVRRITTQTPPSSQGYRPCTN